MHCRLILLLLSFLTWPGLALAQAQSPPIVSTARIQGFTITSNYLSRDLVNQTATLTGNVKVIYQNQYIEADQADINFKKKQAVFVGKVVIQTPAYQIGGRKVTLDYESNQGIIYVGYVQSNNIRVQGDIIEKINDREFYASNADYTACTNCPATWSFDGTQIKAELGGYAYIKNSFLKVGSVPILWLPYLVVPLKSERQTGLLIPEIGYINKRKSVISEDFFWAISRSQDATFTF
jgi:LPS-assembly protein